MGSAAIFHPGAKIKHPALQGFCGVFEVFVDRIVVCRITAVVISVAVDDPSPDEKILERKID